MLVHHSYPTEYVVQLDRTRAFAAQWDMSVWSAEQARHFATIGANVRWERYRARKAALGSVSPMSGAPRPGASTDRFLAVRLAHVRALLDRLDELMMRSKEPAELRDLANATAKLQEQERILDGRPLPGSRRPREQKSQYVQPAVAEPLPRSHDDTKDEDEERPSWFSHLPDPPDY